MRLELIVYSVLLYAVFQTIYNSKSGVKVELPEEEVEKKEPVFNMVGDGVLENTPIKKKFEEPSEETFTPIKSFDEMLEKKREMNEKAMIAALRQERDTLLQIEREEEAERRKKGRNFFFNPWED